MDQSKLITAWREYLGVGDPNNPEMDDQLYQEIKKAEEILSTGVPSIKGMIVSGNRINPRIPPEEYAAAQELIKKSMPTMDALGPPPERTDRPMATKFVISDEDTKIETGDPESTQKQGVMGEKLPPEKKSEKSKRDKVPPKKRLNLDDRMMEMLNLIENVPQT
jgi:hypothetical protein